ncbi:MAG: hypothetical protein KCCBMMGE_01025 [Candidatus Methanoperedenaceae archaeon GB37]|nr:hypothetical protein DMNBHIDG_01526 [Candidatus Methanoperedenaceae archaeon GB37]CAD7780804.1 MAG: hypothetical protein KCCBMMGE_01025 [Candidatus Methanoperedenaceae archaeon GB37]
MYEFVRGPLLWITFIVFVVGSLGKIIYLSWLSWKKDQTVYDLF